MKAGDVRCPMCGAGFADVSPDMDLSGGGPLAEPIPCTTHGRCTNGHSLDVRVTAQTVTVSAWSITPMWTLPVRLP